MSDDFDNPAVHRYIKEQLASEGKQEVREQVRIGLKNADKILREMSKEERDYMPCSEWDIIEHEIVKVLPTGAPKLLELAAKYLMALPEENAGDWCDAYDELYEEVSLQFGSDDHKVWEMALAAHQANQPQPLDDLAREIMDIFWPNGTTQEQDTIFDAQMEKVKQLLQPQGKVVKPLDSNEKFY